MNYFAIVKKPMSISKSSITNNVLLLQSKYSFSDTFFLYDNLPVLLTKLGEGYLDDPINWEGFGTNIIILYFTKNKINIHQFFYKSQFYSLNNIYFSALYYLSKQFIFTSNCSKIRAVNNNLYNIFGVGGVPISFIDETRPFDAYSNPLAIRASCLGTTKTKFYPDEKPLFTSSNEKINISHPTAFDGLIFYTLNGIFNSFKTDYGLSVSGYKNPGEIVQYDGNDLPRYFLFRFANDINTNRAISVTCLPDYNWQNIDTIFAVKQPIIGNNPLNIYINKDKYQPYFYIKPNDLKLSTDSFKKSLKIDDDFYYYIWNYAYVINKSSKDYMIPTLEYQCISDKTNWPKKIVYNSFSTLSPNVELFPSNGLWNTDNQVFQVIFLWENINSFDKFDLPNINPSSNVIGYSLNNFDLDGSRVSPYLFDDKFYANKLTNNGYWVGPNTISLSNFNNFGIIKVKNFKEINYSAQNGLYNYTNKFVDNKTSINDIYDKNKKDIEALSKSLNIPSSSSLYAIDDNPFNLGIRYFPEFFDYKRYYQFKNFPKTIYKKILNIDEIKYDSINKRWKSKDILINVVTPSWSQAAMFVLPVTFNPSNVYRSTSKKIVIYSNIVRAQRGLLIPLFIENNDKINMSYQSITNINRFNIFFNDYPINFPRNFENKLVVYIFLQ